MQQTNLVCNFGRQGLSAFCMILAARASAFLKRFVKFESRQTLSRRLVCNICLQFRRSGGEGPRHGKHWKGKVQGTERQKNYADKVCLKCRQNSADKLCQDTSPPNADKGYQKCRRARWTFPGIADKLCRQSLSTLRAGTPAFLFVYTTLQGLSTAKMQTKFVYSFRRIFCRQSLSAEFVYRACLHDLGMQTKFVYVLK